MTRAEPSWLAARREADVRARESAIVLVRRLQQHLGSGPADGIDIGTGTGANHRYLTGLFTADPCWSVVDHDPGMLNHSAHARAVAKLTSLTDLPKMLDRNGHRGTFLTCSAVLDVLREREIAALTRVIVERRLPALFSLSVTGEVTIHPEHPLDHDISAAFNAHQRRDGRLGPDAGRCLAEGLPAGWLHQVRTPWRLNAAADADLIRRYLTERAQVAVEQDRRLTAPATGWLKLRLEQLGEGHLRVEVGHVDQLVLPRLHRVPPA